MLGYPEILRTYGSHIAMLKNLWQPIICFQSFFSSFLDSCCYSLDAWRLHMYLVLVLTRHHTYICLRDWHTTSNCLPVIMHCVCTHACFGVCTAGCGSDTSGLCWRSYTSFVAFSYTWPCVIDDELFLCSESVLHPTLGIQPMASCL